VASKLTRLIEKLLESFMWTLLEFVGQRDDFAQHHGDCNVTTQRGYRFPSGRVLYVDEERS
jgi:hypothetical protein